MSFLLYIVILLSLGHSGFRLLLSTGQSRGSYHCRSSLLALQAGRVKVIECFFAFVNKKKLPFIAQLIDKGITY